jgi:hypothetical protein
VGPARYSLDQCRRVALIDSASGEAIRGAEDLALDAEQMRLFISAYDRRATEKAARRKQDLLPQGGLYAASLNDLFNPQKDELTLSSLAAPEDFPGGLHPHGISYDSANHELVFINRTYMREGRNWRMIPRLERIGANGEVYVGAPALAHCAANDVAATKSGVYTSFDHASCGFGGGLENVFRLKRSGIVDSNGKIFARAAFANGLAEMQGGEIALAATRESAVLLLKKDKSGLKEDKRIHLPGRPDNITIASGGDIIAAVHPKKFKLLANRKFGIGKSPSRIVSANPDSGEIAVLFDDPRAALFSAATAAVLTERGLVAGSVTDDGLLVCQAKI